MEKGCWSRNSLGPSLWDRAKEMRRSSQVRRSIKKTQCSGMRLLGGRVWVFQCFWVADGMRAEEWPLDLAMWSHWGPGNCSFGEWWGWRLRWRGWRRKTRGEEMKIRRIENSFKKFCCEGSKKWGLGDFPGGPVARTPHSQCRRPGFDPWSGTRSHMPQLRVCMSPLKIPNAVTKIPNAETKTRHSQIS